MWSAINVLKISPRISDQTKKDACQLNFLILMENSDKSTAVQISAVFGTR